MRAIQGSFPRLKDRLLFSDLLENRKVFLNLITMLVNFRTCHIGLNQLKSPFYPKFEAVGDDQVCNLHRSVQIWGIDFGQLAIGLT
jgi:hypothetical protein